MFKIHIYSYFYFKSKIQIIKFPKNSIHQNQNRLIKTYNITYTLNLYYIFKFIRYFSYHSAFFSYFFSKKLDQFAVMDVSIDPFLSIGTLRICEISGIFVVALDSSTTPSDDSKTNSVGANWLSARFSKLDEEIPGSRSRLEEEDLSWRFEGAIRREAGTCVVVSG